MEAAKPWFLVACLFVVSTAAFSAESRWEEYREAGNVALKHGHLEKAARLFTAALEEAEQFGSRDPRLARSLVDLARVYDAQGQTTDADRLYKRALAIAEKDAGKGDPELAAIIESLADRALAQGKPADAERLYKRALAIWEKALGKSHPMLVTIMEHYAAVLRDSGRTAEAVKLEKRAAGIRGK